MFLDGVEIVAFETITEAIQALLDGEVDSIVISEKASKKFISEHNGKLELIGRSLTLNNTASYWESFEFIYVGLTITVRVSIFSYLIALVFGLFAGLGRISSNKFFNNLSTLYVELIRGIPILVLIFIIALVIVPALVESLNGLGGQLIEKGMTQLGQFLADLSIRNIPSEWRAIIALSVTYGAFLAEIFRAGIQSIGRGQMEASRSLGMSISQAMRYVILPQAVRNVLPALGNDFVAMVKDSSLVSVLAVQDITQLSRKYTGTSFRYKEAFTVLTILYLTMTVSLSLLVRLLERRMRQDD
ncbi:MAG: ABC transporter substrate-binding protein/permease [Chloroflexi bacterium]|nr:ABC transporter substrate-binding protein/permease [Chloroflexota bacterium]